ncbi:MAG: DNA translocase FtsK [Flavobacteriales bacterium]|nr:MAG: DNA translocase FtsK [Flavobacteriales bacterium]
MAKKAVSSKKDKSTEGNRLPANLRYVFGYLFLLTSGFLFISILSYFVFWQRDYSSVDYGFWANWRNPDVKFKNFGGKIGGAWAHQLVYYGYGVAALLWPYLIGQLGLRLAFDGKLQPMWRISGRVLFLLLWIPLFSSFLLPEGLALLYGANGLQLNRYFQALIGPAGTLLMLFTTALIFVMYVFKITPVAIKNWYVEKRNARKLASELKSEDDVSTVNIAPKVQPVVETPKLDADEIDTDEIEEETSSEVEFTTEMEEGDEPLPQPNKQKVDVSSDLEIADQQNEPVSSKASNDAEDLLEVEQVVEEETLDLRNQKVKEFGEYDPTLDLSRFQLPPIDLLKQYGTGNITIDSEELEANKIKIVNTLADYKIEIAKIKATIGPTVTLYEIVPAAGVRISKIKNLEDDIALSLSALGIRIIAPIPGKGTIGIEVPNQNPQMVSMRNLLMSEKYQNSNFDLPIAFGKTISNETLIADLAKMPHLLMAGATGQGKSVGLNVILTSILYKKHPSQVKFVLVDPKKVELTLFNKIERHYLAKLPNNEEAIITDTKKVIYTLNSLCIEMDDRYDLLKNAMVRNIKEYNAKFIQRRLNPEEGHRYLPYIVLVIDEFADLIMTAGKEVETPIARLAQLARAIGIHLIVATQRPSVNVITGMIKANFPARIAFRVTAKVDSRTILDTGGAEQLIGKGDMLYSTGSDLTRIQCAFVDTPEIEAITDFIGSQQGYPEAYILPEYEGEEGGDSSDIDLSDRDAMFEEAARIIVQHQQGSASLLQRKLRLGYNRAGRLIDQLEAAGIIGPFEGSKARQVNIKDEGSLEQLLKNLNL